MIQRWSYALDTVVLQVYVNSQFRRRAGPESVKKLVWIEGWRNDKQEIENNIEVEHEAKNIARDSAGVEVLILFIMVRQT